MTNTKSYITNEHARFAQMLEHQPISHFWDWSNGTCRVADAKEAMKSMSKGERMMAAFFIGLWLGENKLKFDLLEAARRLDGGNRSIILHWLENPFWP